MNMIGILFSISFFSPAPSPLTWYSFQDGMAKAQKEHKTVLIDFYTDWCGWCKVMDEETYTDPNVIRHLNEKYVLIRMNPELNESVTYRGQKYSSGDFAMLMGVDGYPSTAFLEENGNMMTIFAGFVEAPDFLKVLRYVEEKKFKDMTLDEYMEAQGSR